MLRRRRSQQKLESRLDNVRGQLALERENLRVAQQQLQVLREEEEQAHVRMLVSEGLTAQKSWQEARRHVEVLERSVEVARQRIDELGGIEEEVIGELTDLLWNRGRP